MIVSFARVVAVAALLALLAVLPAAASAHAGRRLVLTPSSPVTPGSGYVALGDSVTFGYQEPGVVPTPDYGRPNAFRGYPEQLGWALHLRVANFSCPGETSSSLINVTAPTFGCEDGYRPAFPLHVRYRGAQLAAAVAYLRAHPGVRLVTLMIGANDLFLCETTTPDHCASPAERGAATARVARNIRTILTAVRRTYSGQLVVVNYYSTDYASASVTTGSVLLNRTQDTAARPFHVRFADGFGQWQLASRRFGSNPCLAGLLTQVGAYGDCGVHPSYAGQALLAKAVTAATRL